MYSGFDLQLDKNSIIFEDSKEYEKLRKIGENHLNNQKASFEKKLEVYVEDNIIDGTKIQDEWFPEIEADIFISHSGDDNELANALAGWLYHTFGLRCFIDSNVWGYSKTLLEMMNSRLSHKRKDTYGVGLYDHESCNQVSQHVNTMLSIALQKMIDKTETVVLLNTNNTVKVCSETQMEKTYSPWIYSEIICTKFVRKKPLLAYRKYKFEENEFSAIYESVQFEKNFDVSYSVSLEHLKSLRESDLLKWEKRYNKNYEYALDALYEIMCPGAVESTKNLSYILKKRGLDVLQHACSASDINSEEWEKVQSILERIIRRSLLCCQECGMFRDTLDE